MPAGRQADAVAPRTSLHGDRYRCRPNRLESRKTTHHSQENWWGPSIRPLSLGTYLRKRWNQAFGKGELRIGFCGGETRPGSAALRRGGDYFLYTVGSGPFSSVLRSQIMPSRV